MYRNYRYGSQTGCCLDQVVIRLIDETSSLSSCYPGVFLDRLLMASSAQLYSTTPWSPFSVFDRVSFLCFLIIITFLLMIILMTMLLFRLPVSIDHLSVGAAPKKKRHDDNMKPGCCPYWFFPLVCVCARVWVCVRIKYGDSLRAKGNLIEKYIKCSKFVLN